MGDRSPDTGLEAIAQTTLHFGRSLSQPQNSLNFHLIYIEKFF
ncbi:hypothetical protein [Scytonema sp. PRP1]